MKGDRLSPVVGADCGGNRGHSRRKVETGGDSQKHESKPDGPEGLTHRNQAEDAAAGNGGDDDRPTVRKARRDESRPEESGRISQSDHHEEAARARVGQSEILFDHRQKRCQNNPQQHVDVKETGQQ